MNGSKEVNNTKRVPGFFKVFIESMSSKSMQIPSSFVSYMKGLIPKKPILKDDQGKSWAIGVERIGDEFFFVNGWPEYVSDLSLKDGHFLIFDYDGMTNFKFTCLKYENDELEKTSSLMITNEDKEGSTKKGEEMVKIDVVTLTKEKDVPSSSKINEFEVEEPSSKINEFEGEEVIFKYGIVKRPNNPYFVARLRNKRRNSLYIPKDILIENDIKLPSIVTLLDEEGRKIYAKVQTWDDKRVWLTRGWKLFVTANNLTNKDKCICEFIKSELEVYLLMTVIRDGSWLPK